MSTTTTTTTSRKRRDHGDPCGLAEDCGLVPAKRLALQMSNLSLTLDNDIDMIDSTTTDHLTTNTTTNNVPMCGLMSHGSKHTVVIEDIEEELRAIDDESQHSSQSLSTTSTIILHQPLPAATLKQIILPICCPAPDNALILWQPPLVSLDDDDDDTSNGAFSAKKTDNNNNNNNI